MPMLNMRFVLPDHVIDLNRVEGLSYIREANGALEIGAMTRQRDLEFSDLVKARCPLHARGDACTSATARPATAAPSAARSAISIRRPSWSSVAAAHDATVTVAGPERRARDRVRGVSGRLS